MLYTYCLINCFFHLIIYCEHFPMTSNTTQHCVLFFFLQLFSISLYGCIINQHPVIRDLGCPLFL